MPRPHQNVITLILAGGQGERLFPLTRDRAKPAVPFGGCYRIVDFTLNNCIHSGLRQIYVLPQYKSQSLSRHLDLGWNMLSPDLGEFLMEIHPQQRTVKRWYAGTADAIFQNIYTLERDNPEWVLILSGDHVYKMDYMDMLEFHLERGADLTVGCVTFPASESRHFGVMEVDDEFQVTGFTEKPTQPKTVPGRPDQILVNMGIYIFNRELLVKRLEEDAEALSSHDFGKDIIPRMLGTDTIFAYPFEGYWRDIGTLDAYFQSNMDLLEEEPPFDLYDPSWPIRTHREQAPPARIVEHGPGSAQEGRAVNSLISAGSLIDGAKVQHSVLSTWVRLLPGAEVIDSVLLEGVKVGSGAKVKNAILDKGVEVPENARIGYDLEVDRRRFTVTHDGLVVVPKEMKI